MVVYDHLVLGACITLFIKRTNVLAVARQHFFYPVLICSGPILPISIIVCTPVLVVNIQSISPYCRVNSVLVLVFEQCCPKYSLTFTVLSQVIASVVQLLPHFYISFYILLHLLCCRLKMR